MKNRATPCCWNSVPYLPLLLMLATLAADVEAQEPAKLPPARRAYMGREIARTMHFSGAPWLIRNEREREERCSLMLTNLGVKPGMTICDMGCGNGFHTLKLARMVGAGGHVLGVDVQPEMLKLLRDRMEQVGLENITPLLGSYPNPPDSGHGGSDPVGRCVP